MLLVKLLRPAFLDQYYDVRPEGVAIPDEWEDRLPNGAVILGRVEVAPPPTPATKPTPTTLSAMNRRTKSVAEPKTFSEMAKSEPSVIPEE